MVCSFLRATGYCELTGSFDKIENKHSDARQRPSGCAARRYFAAQSVSPPGPLPRQTDLGPRKETADCCVLPLKALPEGRYLAAATRPASTGTFGAFVRLPLSSLQLIQATAAKKKGPVPVPRKVPSTPGCAEKPVPSAVARRMVCGVMPVLWTRVVGGGAPVCIAVSAVLCL